MIKKKGTLHTDINSTIPLGFKRMQLKGSLRLRLKSKIDLCDRHKRGWFIQSGL